MSNQNSKPEVTKEQIESSKKLEKKVVESKPEVTEKKEWISPLEVSYKQLEELLGENSLEDYVGDNLPEEEVKRIKTDFEIYLKNK